MSVNLGEEWAREIEEGRVRRVAEVLYDELTGRGDREGFSANAALARVETMPGPMSGWQKRDKETYQLLKDADYLGYEVHRSSGDRYQLSVRLAKLILEALDE